MGQELRRRLMAPASRRSRVPVSLARRWRAAHLTPFVSVRLFSRFVRHRSARFAALPRPTQSIRAHHRFPHSAASCRSADGAKSRAASPSACVDPRVEKQNATKYHGQQMLAECEKKHGIDTVNRRVLNEGIFECDGPEKKAQRNERGALPRTSGTSERLDGLDKYPAIYTGTGSGGTGGTRSAEYHGPGH